MVLSGEGSDEMFGGYLYFHKVARNRTGTPQARMRKECKHSSSDLLGAAVSPRRALYLCC